MSGEHVSFGGRLVFGILGLVSTLLALALLLGGAAVGGFAGAVAGEELGLGGNLAGVLTIVGAIVGFLVGSGLAGAIRKPISRRKAYYYTWAETYDGPEEVGAASFALAGEPADLPGVDEEELLGEIAGEVGFDGDIDDAIEASDDFGGADGDGGGGGGFDGGGGGGGE